MATGEVVRVRGLVKTYGSVRALDGVELAVRAGEVVAVLGPNGAGKSTLFETLLGLLDPTAGEVRVLGETPSTRTRRRIGVMMQSAGLPESVTVAELVRLIARAHPRALPTDGVLDRVALGPHAGRRVTDLSGGERQRLQLAMALVGAPELLLLDEPTAAMDVRARRSFWKHTREAADAGVTVVFSTHNLTEAGTADRVVVIDAGRVLADATAEDLTEHGDQALEDVFLALTEETSDAQ
ncbi:MAG TPA: ABC transporter ATP-binding protein [Nocardioidaceae bacterium]|nr:ABC transporter ATP-binding protein [Nocardioidaceae bacterium]